MGYDEVKKFRTDFTECTAFKQNAGKQKNLNSCLIFWLMCQSIGVTKLYKMTSYAHKINKIALTCLYKHITYIWKLNKL